MVRRRNWLFVGSDDGAERTCTFVSLIASCALHRLPQAYLRDLFRDLPTWPRSRVLELAPKYRGRTRDSLDVSNVSGNLTACSLP